MKPVGRRLFVKGLMGAFVQPALASAAGGANNAPGTYLLRRAPGELDIHHIDTSCGNATLIVGPDRGSVLIDAGATADTSSAANTPRPDVSRRAGEWIARYAARHLDRHGIDYAIATHIHPDHIGDVVAGAPLSPDGTFHLTGLSEVDAALPIGKIIDRSYPNFGSFHPGHAPFCDNYLRYLAWRQAHGRPVEAAQVGANDQVLLATPRGEPECRLRFLAANGIIWDGRGNQTHSLFPQGVDQIQGGGPSENQLSVALRLTYGAFSYFSGGDLSADDHDGRHPWLDVETPVAKLAGRTEVAVANHHGYFDACARGFVKALNPQAMIVQAWHATHPGQAEIQRMLGDWPGATQLRDVYATSLHPANALLNARFVGRLRSRGGHVVVRVAAGGQSYRIFIIDSSVETGVILAASLPYFCRIMG